MAARLAKVQGHGWAWLVAEQDGEVTGYADFAQFRDRSAYRFSAEDSIYVRNDIRGQGVGKALVAELLTRAEAAASGRSSRWWETATMSAPSACTSRWGSASAGC
jgi:phosphinothricin acetyltransferase